MHSFCYKRCLILIKREHNEELRCKMAYVQFYQFGKSSNKGM